ncbi:MAG: HAMP domain-containing histidine kinase [Chloroflexota bacterium]|nr:HAMP domain-containing histidine kinase [Chloroflexota bacterium]
MNRLLRSHAPFQGAPLQTLLESAAGFVALQLLAVVLDPFHRPPASLPALVVTITAWMWAFLWPALRLRPLRLRGVKLPLPRIVARTLLAAIVVGLLSASIAYLATRLTGSPYPFRTLRNAALGMSFLFLVARIIVVCFVGIRLHIRRRLRRQLMVSHVMAIVLTVMTMTSLGSLIALSIVLRNVSPDPIPLARSAQTLLQLGQTSRSLDVPRLQATLDQIENGPLLLQGWSPLESFVEHTETPLSALVVRPDGSVIAAAYPRHISSRHMLTGIGGTVTNSWQVVRKAALAGHITAVALPGYDLGLGHSVLSGAPLQLRGHTVAIVVLEVPQIAITPSQFIPAAFALFSAATFALVVATALPIIALSFLLSYFAARRLTRNLEAVSVVTTSIASGDFTRRAPRREDNEVGKLAGNVNRMAAHLEATMGELEAARHKAEDALQSRQALVANISHELRTPLAVIRAHLEALLERHPVAAGASLPSEIELPAPTLQALHGETERLGALIEDLFALSRTDAGQIEVRRDRIDVALLADEVAALMRPLAQQEGSIAISVQAPPGVPCALADPDRLRQILANLVRNAVRHTADGGIIVIAVTADDAWVVLSVADTGIGIAPDHLPHVFDRFYRVDEARNRESGGAGLGLSIVREFVELMGGTVTVESVPGEGTCFRVFLPLAR